VGGIFPRMPRLDMHLHTSASPDCRCAPERVVERAVRLGLDRIVITDHDEIWGALRARDLDPERVLVGEEVRTREGVDVIGILLEHRIAPGQSLAESCAAIREQGGIVYLPHPFDIRRGGGGSWLEQRVEVVEMVDVVEVHNARTWRAALDRRADEWAEAHGKLRGAGSDAHTLGEMGRGVVELPDFAPEREAMLAALGRGRVVVARRSSPARSLLSTYATLRGRLEERAGRAGSEEGR
jgi:predicted metal-dependent phosphoesterase TrpH